MFTLPRLDAAIATTIEPRSARLRGAILARTLHRAGILNDRTFPESPDREPWLVAQAALTHWLNQQLNGLRCLHPRFVLAIDDESGSVGETVGVVRWYGHAGTWCVGTALEAIEAIRPRLGQTILHALEWMSWRTLPLFTPGEAIGWTSSIYWYGEQDETLALDEQCPDDPAQREEMRESMLTLAAFEKTHPKWALHWQEPLKPLKPRTLRRLAADLAPSSPLRFVCERTAALLDLPLGCRMGTESGEIDGEFCGYAGLLCWSESEQMTSRIADDMMQMVYESGEGVEECGAVRLRLDEADDLLTWLSRMTHWFEAVRLIDQLIFALVHGDWSKSKESAT